MIVRRRGSHINFKIGSQMALRLSVLRVCCALPPGRFLVLALLEAEWAPRP
jgi:hypothetical protein